MSNMSSTYEEYDAKNIFFFSLCVCNHSDGDLDDDDEEKVQMFTKT